MIQVLIVQNKRKWLCTGLNLISIIENMIFMLLLREFSFVMFNVMHILVYWETNRSTQAFSQSRVLRRDGTVTLLWRLTAQSEVVVQYAFRKIIQPKESMIRRWRLQ
jgi:uncharacterized membrane protein YqjE